MVEPVNANQYKRQPAVIVQIGDIHKSTFVKPGGWEPNFLQTPFGEKVSRANVIGVVVEPPVMVEGMTQFSCTVDDGTGTIQLRSFEPIEVDGELEMGTAVLVIGRPREYNNVFYILPEIIRPVDKDWLDYRKKELETLDRKVVVEVDAGEEFDITPQNEGADTLLDLIDQKDTGDGVSVDELVLLDKSNEEKISRLLLHGEVYEVKPGRIKVLK